MPVATTSDAPTKYKTIGTRPIRHDGTDKVTGKAIYGADVRLPGMLFGQVLRSPLAHARILSIDCSKALALDGVHAVMTSKDLPIPTQSDPIDLGETFANPKYLRDNVLASDKVLYQGHAVAAVAASNSHLAQEALEHIQVEYEVLPPVMKVLEAMKDGAPLLHDSLTTQSLGEDTGKKSNIASYTQFKLGDPESAFGECAHVVEHEFDTATVHQGYIEPHNVTAIWNQDDQLTVWTSTQGAFSIRTQLHAVLGHPISKIKVIPTEIGGGFGGKIPIYTHPVAARLSQKTGRPVKILMSRENEFQSTGPTPGTYVRVKMGTNAAGKLLAAQAYLAYEAGAYPGSAIGAGMMCVLANYDIPNAVVDGYDVVVNKPRSFAYRAPGATQALFGTETVLDELAIKCGVDPLEIRIMNTAHEGTRRVDGLQYPRIGCLETLKAARDHEQYRTPLEGPHKGRGVATGFWFNAGLQSSVVANVNTNGTVNLVEGSTDIGGSRTSIAMQFAEVLGLPIESVNPQVADTDSIGYTEVTGGSRTTFATGLAAIGAANDVSSQVIERAAKLWETDPESVTYSDGACRHATDGDKQLTFAEVAAKQAETGGPIIGRATVNPETGIGGAFATCIADVEVDPETGKVTVLRFTVVQDAGTAIHPSYVEGQMQGGSVQGIGWALNEEYFYNEDGRLENGTFLDFRMPTTFDLPPIDTVIVEVPNPGHPFGVRGVGEVSIGPPPAAIANAIYRAVGVRLRALPMRPDRVFSAIRDAE